MEWLMREVKKDDKEIDNYKKKLINEIKGINKDDMISKINSPKTQKKKKTKLFFKKILIIFGYGR